MATKVLAKAQDLLVLFNVVDLVEKVAMKLEESNVLKVVGNSAVNSAKKIAAVLVEKISVKSAVAIVADHVVDLAADLVVDSAADLAVEVVLHSNLIAHTLKVSLNIY